VNWEALLDRALDLARRGAGEVEPNPRVGALALEGGEVVGEGWHAFWGGPHAEPAALEDARRRGRRPDTVVVTLEPCSTTGKTPACTDLLIREGVKRLVCGAVDPDPRHRGRGLEILRRAGVEVIARIREEACLQAAGPFLRWLTMARPWVIGKWAMSLDGKIATRTGASRWITPRALRARAHLLRARVDAVLVGSGTVAADDPELTVRLAEGPDPAVLVADPELEISLDRKLVKGAGERIVVLLAEEGSFQPGKRAALEERGVEVLSFPSPLNLAAALEEVRRRKGWQRILCEGGGRLLGSLHDLGLLDQVEVHLGPRLIGGSEAPGPLGGLGPSGMEETLPVDVVKWEAAGGGFRLVGFPGRSGSR